MPDTQRPITSFGYSRDNPTLFPTYKKPALAETWDVQEEIKEPLTNSVWKLIETPSGITVLVIQSFSSTIKETEKTGISHG